MKIEIEEKDGCLCVRNLSRHHEVWINQKPEYPKRKFRQIAMINPGCFFVIEGIEVERLVFDFYGVVW